jgi:hypothetical protein
MNYLSGSETQANVAVLWAVSRWLRHVGEAPLANLAVSLRPSAVVQGAENALRASLLVGRHIGVLQAVDDSGPWSLGARMPQHAVGDHLSFRCAIRDALLTQAVEDATAGRQPADVAIGLAWFCSLDPALPLPWGWNDGTEVAVRKVGLDSVINNNTQWRPFRRWAISLGVAVANNPRGAVQVLVPDATAAVEETLSRLPSRTIAPVFLEGLAFHLPIVDTGLLERVASEFGVSYAARGDASIGPGLAHALRRLDRRGVLSLNKAADASHRVSYRTSTGMDAFDDVVIAGRPDD